MMNSIPLSMSHSPSSPSSSSSSFPSCYPCHHHYNHGCYLGLRRLSAKKLRIGQGHGTTAPPSFSPKSCLRQHPLDLTEDNVKQVLVDARAELAQIFDSSVGITGEAQLAELDGPFVTIALRGRFWHKRSMVLARLDNYLKKRIPEIMEVSIEDERQLDDSPENV